MRWIACLFLVACADHAAGPSPSQPTPPGPPAEREARTAIDTYTARAARCQAAPDRLECMTETGAPADPCKGPQPFRGVSSFARGGHAGSFYDDGQRCYQATAAELGPCGPPNVVCHAWTSLEACEAARRICRD